MSRCKSYQKLVTIIAPQLVQSVTIFVDQKCLIAGYRNCRVQIEQDMKQRFGVFPCPHDQDVGVTTQQPHCGCFPEKLISTEQDTC